MNRSFYVFLILLLSFAAPEVLAQDTLPRFTVSNVGRNRIIIGWINAFQQVKQISIQRSHDSVRNYKTILSVADPNAVQNGYMDTRAPNDHMWYRLFYVLGNNTFYFTEAKQPAGIPQRQVPIDSLAEVADSFIMKETLMDTVVVVKKPEFVPSFYVYANKDGNVFINLPDADKKSYSIKFFEEDDTYLFEIRNIKETGLSLDKANFHHAGWFRFELYDNDKLVERHRFYLSKSF